MVVAPRLLMVRKWVREPMSPTVWSLSASCSPLEQRLRKTRRRVLGPQTKESARNWQTLDKGNRSFVCGPNNCLRVFRNRCSRSEQHVDNDQSVGTVGDIGSLTHFRTISCRGATTIKANGIT
jgi:hypothetical protein